jgi:cytochrome oxidase Cu insertion factor (SCO1/SenC/PrrC family)
MTEPPAKPPSRARRILKRVLLGFLALAVVLGGLVAYGVYRPIARRAGLVVASAKAPDFSLPDQRGATTTLAALTANGPAVLVFYRGFW